MRPSLGKGIATLVVIGSSATAFAEPQDFSYQHGYYHTMQCGRMTEGGTYAGRVVVSHETSAENPTRIKMVVTTYDDHSDSLVDKMHEYGIDLPGCGEKTYIINLTGTAQTKVKAGQRLTRTDYGGISLLGASVNYCTRAERELPNETTVQDISNFIILYNTRVNRSQVRTYFAHLKDVQDHKDPKDPHYHVFDLHGLEAACASVGEKVEVVRIKANEAVEKFKKEKGRVGKEVGQDEGDITRRTGGASSRAQQIWRWIRHR